METFEILSLGSRAWPRLAAIVVIGTLVFAPRFAGSLIERAAQERAQQITSLLTRSFKPALRKDFGGPRAHHAR